MLGLPERIKPYLLVAVGRPAPDAPKAPRRLVTWLNDLTRRVGAEALARQAHITQSQRTAGE